MGEGGLGGGATRGGEEAAEGAQSEEGSQEDSNKQAGVQEELGVRETQQSTKEKVLGLSSAPLRASKDGCK